MSFPVGRIAGCLSLCMVFSVLLLCTLGRAEAVELRVNLSGSANLGEPEVLQRFRTLYPRIDLESATGITIATSGAVADSVPLMQIAGDVAPDVLNVTLRNSDVYIMKGFLKPLDEYLADANPEQLARRVPPAIRSVCYRMGPDGRRHWYLLPVSKSVRVILFRRDMFRKAGLPDRPPANWEELEEFSRKLTNPKGGKYGLGVLKGDNSAYDFVDLALSAGGKVVVQDNKGKWRPNFNSKEVVDALYFYLRLCRMPWKTASGQYFRGSVARESDTSYVSYLDPSYAMAFWSVGDRFNHYKPDLWGYGPVPSPKSAGQSFSQISCGLQGIYAGVKSPDTARAAFDYIWFHDGDEANRMRIRTYIQKGYSQFVNPDLLERFGYREYLADVNKEWVQVYKQALVSGQPEPYGHNCSMIYKELSRPVEQALNDRTALAALDRGDETAVKQRLKEILDYAQSKTAMAMHGEMPPKAKQLRLRLTTLFLLVLAVVLCLTTAYFVRLTRRTAGSQPPGVKKLSLAYLLLMPAILSIIIWQYYPLLKGTIISFQDYNVMGRSTFVGVENFSAVLFDPGFWHSIRVTLVYTGLYIGVGFTSPIVLALLLTEIPSGKVFYRTVFYLPAVLSGLVVMFLWKSFYNAAGPLNTMLGYIGVNPGSNWLDTPSLAMIAALLPVIWAGMGPGSLIYIAALKTIPEELYEAAEVDGADIIKKVFSITLPSIKMLILINLVGALGGAFMSADGILAMTGGGPYTPFGATEVVGLQLFYTAFVYLKFGIANAMAWVVGFMLIGLTLMQIKNLSRVEFKSGS